MIVESATLYAFVLENCHMTVHELHMIDHDVYFVHNLFLVGI
jgi:hypothetical protein